MSEKTRVPKFGWLLIACFASWIFCGWLVWFVMTSDMSQCCDLTFLEKLTIWFK